MNVSFRDRGCSLIKRVPSLKLRLHTYQEAGPQKEPGSSSNQAFSGATRLVSGSEPKLSKIDIDN